MRESGHPRVSGARPHQARRTNTAAVLHLLAQRGPLSRGDLARELRLNHGSVSRIIEPLVGSGLVRELPEEPVGRGRPRVPLVLNASGRHAVGVHLGLQRTTVGLTDLAGRCVRSYAEERDPTDVAATLERAAQLVATAIDAAPSPVVGVGVTTGGTVDREHGVVVRNDALGWDEVPVAAPLQAATGLPTLLDSTVRAQLGAELAFGAGRGRQSVLYVFVGNVLEAGFADSAAAPESATQGDLGRLLVPTLTGTGTAPFARCGTDRALLEAADRLELNVSGLEDLARLAEHDPGAAALLDGRCAQIAHVVDVLSDLQHPDLVVLGGGAAPGPHWLQVIRGHLQAIDPARVVGPRSDSNPLVTAAAGVVVRAFLADGLTRDDEKDAHEISG